MKKRYLLTSNDLISYLMSKKLESSPTSTTIFHDAFKGKCTALLEDFVLIEAITQFEQAFQIPRERIQHVLCHLLRYKGLVVSDEAVIRKALSLFARSQLPYSTCLLHAKTQLQQYETIEALPSLPLPQTQPAISAL